MTATTNPPSGQTEAPRRHWLVIAFVATTLVSAAVGAIGSLYTSGHDAAREQQASKVDEFSKHAYDLDLLVREFVADIKDGRLTESSKKKLRENLLAQMVALREVKSIAPERSVPSIEKYLKTLSRADTELKTATKPLDSGKFAQEVVHIAEQRDKLLKELRKDPPWLPFL